MPAELLEAARRFAYKVSVVKVRVAGDDVLCVIGDEGGSPGEWFVALREYAERPPTAQLEERQLPRGLWAVALRQHGVLICVSVLRTAAEQKAAASRLLRAARRERWVPAAVPALLAPAVAGWDSAIAWFSARPARAALALVGAVAAAAVLVTTLGVLPASSHKAPFSVPPPKAGIGQQPQASRSHGSRASHRRRRHRLVAVPVHARRPGPGLSPVPPSASASPSARPSPTPSRLSASATPSRSPSTSPSPSPDSSASASPSPSTSRSSKPTARSCVSLLGVSICV